MYRDPSDKCVPNLRTIDPAVVYRSTYNLTKQALVLKLSVASRSKALVCGRSLPGIAGSNPADGIDVRLF